MSRLLTTDDAAELFGVDRRTIQRWARDQVIPHIRIGTRTIRFTLAQLDEALAAYQRDTVDARPDATLRNPAYTPMLRVVPMRRPHDAA